MEAPATVGMIAKHDSLKSVRVANVAWLLASGYYFYQYAPRSAPAVKKPELSNAFNISALSAASIVGLFYYGYSPFSLVAGAAKDRIGPRRLLPGAAFIVGIGALLFSSSNTQLASVGRFLQGAGGVFAPVGAISIATRNFPPSQATVQVDHAFVALALIRGLVRHMRRT